MDRTLPTGTVTFLFSDMEGSTRLVQDLGPADFAQVLEQHNAILREAYTRHGGVERGTQGDSFLVMFREAPAAVAAAAEAQRALANATWPGGAPVRVRMGMHTGVGTLGGDDYVSVDVNRAARVAALAHGAQVLLSDATRALVEGSLPDGVSLRPLGEFELKDLARPERLSQLVIDGLPSEFPPLRRLDRTVGNLPDPISSFIGRDAELGELASLIAQKRLITLTGPGGTGKTRLTIEAARRAADEFEHGAWFVALDAIANPDLVPSAIASSFSLVESAGTTPIDRLSAYLADRELLLVLDNFEQVIDAAPRIGELLQGALRLHIVVTSRAPLRLLSEQEYPIAPLGLPETVDQRDDALASESVQLFVERAGRVRPGFTLSAEEAPAVVEICRHLDGLPLGIELAASRVRLLPPKVLAERLTKELDLPGSGARDLPARQQTLERAIAWSYDLLDEPSRRLLARLSVFAGGFRLEEAEAVGGSDGGADVEVIEGLTTLAEHSLVQPTTGPDLPRFRLLETIRRFGANRLAESGEQATIQRRHATAYLALAEEAATHMPTGEQVPWLDRMSIDHDNLRAAMSWAVEIGEVELAHRLLTAMWRFWQFRGHLEEGRARAEQVLAMPRADEPSPWRMRAVEAAGGVAWWTAGAAAADALYESQVELARQIGDEAGLADGLFNLAHSKVAIDLPATMSLVAEAEALYRKLGNERQLARLFFSTAYVHMAQAEAEEAERIGREALAKFEANGDVFYLALASTGLAMTEFVKGDLDSAVDLVTKGFIAAQAMGDVASITLGLLPTSALLFVAGLPSDAAVLHAAYVEHRRRFGVQPPLNVEFMMGLTPVVEQMLAVVNGDEFAAETRLGASLTTDGAVEFLAREAVPRVHARPREGTQTGAAGASG